LPPSQQGEPGTEGEPGRVSDPGTDGKPGRVSEPGTEKEPGGVSEPGTDGKPGGVTGPGNFSDPGNLAERRARAGRNLPAALAVGLALGALALLTLFTIKVLFLVVVGVAVALALWELTRALRTRDIRLPLVPVVTGGSVMIALAYWRGERPLVAALAITVIVVMSWRLPGTSAGYLRDVAAGMFALAYLPLMASFVALMLAPADGSRRTVVFLILVVCSDVGGYAAGSLVGRHLLVPKISPKKTWEGSAGAALACVVAGAILLPTVLHAPVWQGVVLGVAAVATATLGDLSESMIKRDLGIKDMGTVLPGHGGALDRIDAMLVSAPVIWLLLTIFIR
jgi:phosphatidate cytidylyltransferase